MFLLHVQYLMVMVRDQASVFLMCFDGVLFDRGRGIYGVHRLNRNVENRIPVIRIGSVCIRSIVRAAVLSSNHMQSRQHRWRHALKRRRLENFDPFPLELFRIDQS